MRVLVAGGAGFIGAHLSLGLVRHFPGVEVIAFDNLRRRGSEWNLPRLREGGVEFLHGDVRSQSDVEDLQGEFDVVIEASAEPAVSAGLEHGARYLIDTNLRGTLNCLELARTREAAFVFLSTSRVYSIGPLRELALREGATRFELAQTFGTIGVGKEGLSEDFPTHLPRSVYGASKLAAELLVQEYAYAHGVKAVINRCGVVAGPGQFGRVDQGVFTLWIARHLFGASVRYRGFGGTGKQVRDLLHPLDLVELVMRQVERRDRFSGRVFNVGGGATVSTSLRELTDLCEEETGRRVLRDGQAQTDPFDIPFFVSDATRVRREFDWEPRRGLGDIVRDTLEWLRMSEATLRPLFI